MIRLIRALRARRADDGVAMPAVIGMGLLMLMLVAGSMTVATSGLVKSYTDEDWNGALAAAYAGVEEYQSRLANDATYSRYGDITAPFSAGTGSTLTLPTGSAENPAFGVGASGTWAAIPTGSDSVPVNSWYRYEVDNSDYQASGLLHLRSTGRVGTVTRSIVADLKQDGFIDYLYFTNYETKDPAYEGGSAATIDPATGKSVCERYLYGSPARNTTTCGGVIQFAPNDVFTGAVRSNDKLNICGSEFQGPVLTSSTSNPIYTKLTSGCGGNPSFAIGTGPTYAAPIDMPPTNTELKKETRNDLPADVPRPGCLYTGPTVISFEIVSGAPKMRVLSPWTRKTNIAATTAGATTPTQCGTPGTGTNGLGSPTGALIDVLELNLIYVQAVPAVGANDPNAPVNGNPPTNVGCSSASGSGSAAIPAGWYYRTSSTNYIARYPAVISSGNNTYSEVVPSGSSALTHYGCRAGDVFLKGTVGGHTTIASENYIYIVDDIRYRDKQSDMLGLVGQNAVFVWNPVRYSSNDFSAMLTSADREIDAAILSVGHTFQVQNYQRVPRGTLTVFGAIAQKFRGTVGQGENGFAKNYQYDDRFRFTAPPKFLTPVSTTYGVTQYAAVTPAFNADGSVP